MGARQLRKIQLGAETSGGALHAATTIWRGSGAIRDDTVIGFGTEDVGILSDTDRTFIPSQGASLAMTATEATFEQLPYILEAGIKKVGTGSADGAGTDKIYTYPLSSTAQNTLQTYSIEGGDNSGAEVVKYGVVTDFVLSVQVFKPLMMSANWIAWETTPQAFTGSLTPIAVDTAIMMAPCKLFIDAIGGTIGTTQISGSMKSLNLKVKTGVETMPSVENLHFTAHAIVDPSITGDIVFYWDANSIAQKAAWLAQTGKLVQLKWEGPSVGTPGTLYSKKTLIANLYGLKWTKFSELQADGGHDVVTASFEARYDVTSANYASLIVVNETAALP